MGLPAFLEPALLLHYHDLEKCQFILLLAHLSKRLVRPLKASPLANSNAIHSTVWKWLLTFIGILKNSGISSLFLQQPSGPQCCLLSMKRGIDVMYG